LDKLSLWTDMLMHKRS